MILFKYFKGLPLDYEYFLVRKYDSFSTTCRYIEVFYPTYDINYFLVYNDSILIDVLVFGNKGNTSQCFNSLVEIDQDIILTFANKIFEKFPDIQKVFIDASYKCYNLNNSFLLKKSDDHILDLPATLDDYNLILGYHTRKNLKNRKVRLLKDYSNVNFITKFGTEIEKTLIDKIIQLNCDRLKHKGIKPIKNNIENDIIYKYSQSYGCVNYLEIDGLIVAGCISTIVNKGIFIQIIAFDNDFAKNNVGEICVIKLIETSIERGLKTIHFLWGETELKKRLLAKPHILYSYLIFRAYSLDFLISKVKTMIILSLNSFKLSKHTLLFRNLIKSFRRKLFKV
jgi:hypothetical protein